MKLILSVNVPEPVTDPQAIVDYFKSLVPDVTETAYADDSSTLSLSITDKNGVKTDKAL